MPSYKVIFTAKFEGYIDADNEDEAVSEVDIPESDSTKYISNSMDVVAVLKKKPPWEGWYIQDYVLEQQGSDMLSIAVKLKHSISGETKEIEESLLAPLNLDDAQDVSIANYGGLGADQQSLLVGIDHEIEIEGEIHSNVSELQIEIDSKTGTFQGDSLHDWQESY